MFDVFLSLFGPFFIIKSSYFKPGNLGKLSKSATRARIEEPRRGTDDDPLQLSFKKGHGVGIHESYEFFVVVFSVK